jgi:hypothetical protein
VVVLGDLARVDGMMPWVVGWYNHSEDAFLHIVMLGLRRYCQI